MREWWSKVDKRKLIQCILFVCMVGLCIYTFTHPVYATDDAAISIDIASTDGSGSLSSLDVMFLLVMLSVLPSMVLICTCFTRIIIVFSLVRSALGTQQSPPNQVLIGLALFMTLFIMQPTVDRMVNEAYEPFKAGEITSEEAFQVAQVPLKEFMLKQVDKSSLNLFLEISNETVDVSEDGTLNESMMELPFSVVAPAFATSELKRAFTMGFLIFLPFVVIDLVVSSTLMSMGMVMLPPASIALPFKILVFVLANGWELLISTLIKSFRI
ncbi:MAG: flagellar type III secretion system pore protein FliP [Erysipelotrichales bacterium]|nr:flagellar type III secretion system pore protein FliP [Erysipelotrichales bacterium]